MRWSIRRWWFAGGGGAYVDKENEPEYIIKVTESAEKIENAKNKQDADIALKKLKNECNTWIKTISKINLPDIAQRAKELDISLLKQQIKIFEYINSDNYNKREHRKLKREQMSKYVRIHL